MTDRVKRLLDFYKAREYRQLRRPGDVEADAQVDVIENQMMLQAACLKVFFANEKPVVFPDDIFGFNRYCAGKVICRDAAGEIRELAKGANTTPNYARVIGAGLDETLRFLEGKGGAFYDSVRESVTAILDFCDRYREAVAAEHPRLAQALARVPHHGAETFYEALVFFKILTYALRGAQYCHLTIGRFDQYMYPYFAADRAKGVPEEELFETLELFFISLNFDTDLYLGVQQGDNGQSMVLGGYAPDGTDQYNDLSRLCMEASLELNVIDPKINLRVNRTTPDERYEFATRLTAKGLGFPQYCNDDVVVPGLIALGYAPEDAYNYTVAACWEYIIPNCGADVPNFATFNFPLVIHDAITEHLRGCDTFEELMERVREAITAECDRIAGLDLRMFWGTPLLSLLTDGCMEQGKDISEGGAKYQNYGCHGAGIAVAADSLAAVKQVIYDDVSVSKDELLAALEANFEGFAALRNRLLNCPKMGNNEDLPDGIACELMEAFSKGLNGKPNVLGGIWRAGTGSAQLYIFAAQECPATPDGRKAYEPYGSSFSPAVTAKLNGPLSVVQSFTKYDLRRIINGGPLTLEVHDTVFRNEEGYRKVAMLVKSFVALGGHQLQLNAINRDRLLDAQKHPENYPNLIVRVWGWSGYFCELDREFQDHIIRRTEFTI